MLPTLLDGEVVGIHVVVPAYLTFLVLAAAAALVLGVVGARRAGFPVRAISLVYAGAIAGGLAGARLLHAALGPAAYVDGSDSVLALAPRGFALYGGLAGAILVVLAGTVVLSRRPAGAADASTAGASAPPASIGATFGRLADSAIPAVVVGILLLRIGCFLNGCCAGIATDLPIGVVFPSGPSAASSVLGIETETAAVHPTQLYELAASVLCGVVALWMARAIPRIGSLPGAAALLFTAGFLTFRAANQVLRTADATAMSGLPTVYLAVALGAVILLATAVARSGNARPRAAAAGAGVQ